MVVLGGAGGAFNPNLTNGFSNRYQLGESTFILGVLGLIFIFISFFDIISPCKQNIPRWHAAFCGVTSEAILFAYVPQISEHEYLPKI